MGETVILNSVVFAGPNNLTYSTGVTVLGFDYLFLSFPVTADTWQNWESGGISMESTSSLPNTVNKHTMQLIWVYTVDSGDPGLHFCDSNPTSHDVYAVLAAPGSPQSQPWQEVLEIACSEASGEGAAAGATRAIWDDFYNSAGATYDNEHGRARYCKAPTHTTGNFLLANWLNAYPSVSTVNCYDMGKSVATFANALGCGTVYTYVYPFGYLNCIKPVGLGWTNNPFYGDSPPWDANAIVDGDANSSDGRSGFARHGFTRLSGDIYDASGGQVDVDGDPDGAPHTAHELDGDDTWTSDYKGKVIDDDPSVTPGTPTNYSFGVE